MPTSGERWELRKGYISTQRAAKIAEEARWLTRQVASCVARADQSSLIKGNYRVSSTTLHLEGSLHNDGFPTLEECPNIIEGLPATLDPYERTKLETGDTAHALSFIDYGPFGRLGRHVDEYRHQRADNTISVVTAGDGGVVVLADPHFGVVRLRTKIGDGLYLDNTGIPEDRIVHHVSNLTTQPRSVYID